jgi:hypothetical protein
VGKVLRVKACLGSGFSGCSFDAGHGGGGCPPPVRTLHRQIHHLPSVHWCPSTQPLYYGSIVGLYLSALCSRLSACSILESLFNLTLVNNPSWLMTSSPQGSARSYQYSPDPCPRQLLHDPQNRYATNSIRCTSDAHQLCASRPSTLGLQVAEEFCMEFQVPDSM